LVRSIHRIGPVRRSREQKGDGGDDGGDDLDVDSRGRAAKVEAEAEADAANSRAAARDSSKSCAAVVCTASTRGQRTDDGDNDDETDAPSEDSELDACSIAVDCADGGGNGDAENERESSGAESNAGGIAASAGASYVENSNSALQLAYEAISGASAMPCTGGSEPWSTGDDGSRPRLLLEDGARTVAAADPFAFADAFPLLLPPVLPLPLPLPLPLYEKALSVALSAESSASGRSDSDGAVGLRLSAGNCAWYVAADDEEEDADDGDEDGDICSVTDWDEANEPPRDGDRLGTDVALAAECKVAADADGDAGIESSEGDDGDAPRAAMRWGGGRVMPAARAMGDAEPIRRDDDDDEVGGDR
jgi:hypothetical protein